MDLVASALEERNRREGRVIGPGRYLLLVLTVSLAYVAGRVVERFDWPGWVGFLILFGVVMIAQAIVRKHVKRFVS